MTDPKPTQQETNQPQPPREFSSEELFRGDRSVMISHSGEQYRLMITRNNKLILQK